MIEKVQDLADGSTVVAEVESGRRWVLKPGQWAVVAAQPPDRQRVLVEHFVTQNIATGDPRTEAEQAQMDAAEQGQGERHQADEEAR